MSVGGGQHLLLLDVAPWTLEMETIGARMTKHTASNSKILAKKSQFSPTYQCNCPAAYIQALEGEWSMTKDNRLLGKLDLRSIPPAPRGQL